MFSCDGNHRLKTHSDFQQFSDFVKESKSFKENLKEKEFKFQDDHHYGGHYDHDHHKYHHHDDYHKYHHSHDYDHHYHHHHHLKHNEHKMHRHHHNPIYASIHSTYSVETYHKKSKHHQNHPVIKINSGPLPLTLKFNSHSSDIHALQHHEHHEGKVEKQTQLKMLMCKYNFY